MSADVNGDGEPRPMLVALDHVQVAIPVGGEAEARSFYVGVLGLAEVAKPPVMAARGGCWFELGPVRLHVGVENDFRPARKAHPAFVVRDLDVLLAAHPLDPVWSDDVPGTKRCHVDDPFGNRLELIDERSLHVVDESRVGRAVDRVVRSR